MRAEDAACGAVRTGHRGCDDAQERRDEHDRTDASMASTARGGEKR